MKRKIFRFLFLTVALAVMLQLAAFGDIIKPVADPWDDPNNLEEDGATYYANGDDGYVIVWETPECDVNGAYTLVENGKALTVSARVTYMDDIPWGKVIIASENADAEAEPFEGWVLMSDLIDENGNLVAVLPEDFPEHPTIKELAPAETEEPEATATPVESEDPEPPEQAITVGNTYNNAIVYTSVAIAVGALALVAYVLIKHKALNKKGE